MSDRYPMSAGRSGPHSRRTQYEIALLRPFAVRSQLTSGQMLVPLNTTPFFRGSTRNLQDS